ncbi:hypothetical protein [Thalassospira sp.]|uniref:hypothetical protein n=1 Tax=Thalassospira sp. TaxID=1912094 RepID=UPI003AA8EDCD
MSSNDQAAGCRPEWYEDQRNTCRYRQAGLGVSPAQPALSGLRNFIIQNRAGLIVFAAGVSLYTPPFKSQAVQRVFLPVSHP